MSVIDCLLSYSLLPLLLSRGRSIATCPNVHLPNCPSRHLTTYPLTHSSAVWAYVCNWRGAQCHVTVFYQGDRVLIDCVKYQLCVSMAGGIIIYLLWFELMCSLVFIRVFLMFQYVMTAVYTLYVLFNMCKCDIIVCFI